MPDPLNLTPGKYRLVSTRGAVEQVPVMAWRKAPSWLRGSPSYVLGQIMATVRLLRGGDTFTVTGVTPRGVYPQYDVNTKHGAGFLDAAAIQGWEIERA